MTRATTSWRRLLLALPALLVAATSVAAACGGSDGGGASSDDSGKTPTGPVRIDVSMAEPGGKNSFAPKDFTVKAGQEVTFNLSNDGIAIHNMHVAGADNQYGSGDDLQSDPQLVDPGDTATLTWTAPDEPGVYDFQCDVHLPDMAGTITVE